MSHWESFKRQQSAKYQPSTHYVIGVDHITAIHPNCMECDRPAHVWRRCKCRAFIALCEVHCLTKKDPKTKEPQRERMPEVLRAHRCKETA